MCAKKSLEKNGKNEKKLKAKALKIDNLITERLILIPYTIDICHNILNNNFDFLSTIKLQKGKGWPDEDVMETLPKIINNLSLVEFPTGFESWMIVKKSASEIIGDIGFKGLNHNEGNIDIGYGIIQEERRKGYAEEAAKALMKWTFSTGLIKEITAKCLIDNLSSVNLLNKLAFTEIRKDDEMIYWFKKLTNKPI